MCCQLEGILIYWRTYEELYADRLCVNIFEEAKPCSECTGDWCARAFRLDGLFHGSSIGRVSLVASTLSPSISSLRIITGALEMCCQLDVILKYWLNCVDSVLIAHMTTSSKMQIIAPGALKIGVLAY